MIDQIAALKVTVQLAKDNPWWSRKEGSTVKHLENMLERVLTDKDMDDGKVGRFLGWAQAVLVLYSPKEFTLDDMKKLNKSFKVKHKKRKKDGQKS